MPDLIAGVLIGALVPLALAVLAVALLAAARALLFASAHLTARANPHQRAATAAVMAGARRARVWSFGSVGVAFIVGLDNDARRAAYEKLRPTTPAPRPLARPRRRPEAGQVEPDKAVHPRSQPGPTPDDHDDDRPGDAPQP